MKLKYKQAHLVKNIVLFPLWLLNIIAIVPFYIFLTPIWLYNTAEEWADTNIRLRLQGRIGKEWWED